VARLLLLGGSVAQLPLVHTAHRIGLDVAVADARPDAPGMAAADTAVAISSLDHEALVAWASRHPVDGVLTVGSDRAVVVVARVASALRLPGLSIATALLASDKAAMRDRFDRAGVPCPRWRPSRSVEEALGVAADLGYPVIVKPSDNAAQRGVALATDELDLRTRAEQALAESPSRTLLVEEVADGPEYTANTLTLGGSTTVVTLTERLTTPPPFPGIALGHVYPAGLTPDREADVVGAALAAVRALGIDDSPGYTQVRLTAGGPRVIETAARLGGGCDALLAKLVTGIDLEEAVVRLALGQAPAVAHPRAGLGPYEAGCSLFAVDGCGGFVEAIVGLDEARRLPGVHDVQAYFRPGQVVPPAISGEARRVHAVAGGHSREEALSRARRALVTAQVLVRDNPADRYVREEG